MLDSEQQKLYFRDGHLVVWSVKSSSCALIAIAKAQFIITPLISNRRLLRPNDDLIPAHTGDSSKVIISIERLTDEWT